MSNWQDFLGAQGASRETNGEISFQADSTHSKLCPDTTYLTELGYQGLLAFDGIDAAKFLQGQVTTDVRELANGQWKLGAQCNLKGRMQASFALVQTHPEQILLRCHASLTASIAENLKKYAAFSKVSISDVSTNWRRFGLLGPAATECVNIESNLQLAHIGDAQTRNGIVALMLDEQRCELWVSAERAEALWQKLAARCALGGSRRWQLADIRAGWAEITASNIDSFSPQELHYPLIGAVSFKKGCYTGQEVVARLHYKGKLKKHMARIALGIEKLDVNAEIVDDTGKKRGSLVMIAPVDDHYWEALAVLPDDEGMDLYLDSASAGQAVVKVERMSLPYPRPTADNNPQS